ncbi:MAG: hypothetical protein RLZZ306_758 [Bacteroidota bacterium]
MKKNLLILSIMVFYAFATISVQAQNEIAIAKSYLTANAAKEKLSATDIAEMSVSSAYLSPTTNWYHLFFNQTYQSVEVYNGIMGVTLNNGQVGYVANSFVANLASQVPSGLISTKITSLQALEKAAASVNLVSNSASEISKSLLSNGLINKVSYLDPSISNEKIDVKLYWLPYEVAEGKELSLKVALTWNVRITTKDGKNIWNTHVDATSGNILKTNDDVIHCNFGTPEHSEVPHICIDKKMPNSTTSKALVANSYKVFDYPLESPNHGTNTFTSVLSPYTRFVPAGTGPGSTNGWHSDGITSFTITQGNNVFAKEDLAADNEVTIGASPNSSTLDFNYTYSQTTGTAAINRDAAITNLFYWNNIMHDILWKFGFDEPGGNFQKNNLSRGGAGNDFVFADAQDGSGTNNANFATPADGSNPRMQMFIFSNTGSPVYQPDSDFDNGVIAHEYGHGWSNRLTGGPSIVNCLQNAEQGGEGWSDYVALMTTTKWASLTPTVASANIPRGIGTYVLGQDTTGLGIRTFRYSYDKVNVNNTITYARVADLAIPHGVGSIWAAVLWDMTWEMILQDNFIAPNIYDVPATIADYRGNIAAMKLVNEGLRLQPCSPSFVQARDAILQADQMLFGGRYKCSIWKSFARRGLGLYASTGTSTNDRAVIEDFTPFISPALSSPLNATTCSNQVFSYTATTAVVGTFTYAWTRAAVAGISNSAGSGSSAIISETLINTTPNPIIVEYSFTLTPNECGLSQIVNVTVNPTITPTVPAYTVCQNASVPSGEGLAVAAVPLATTVNGILVSGTTYVRGIGDNVTTYTASRPVFYKTFTFVAPAAGSVTFATTAAVLSSGDEDTYLTLYQNSFNPASPATNFVRGDDDSGSGFLSSLTQTLTAGTTYIVVVSTFSTGVTGTFTLQASSAVFGQTVRWYLNASGGSPLATGAVFNPVGVAGSGIPNTSTLGSTTFYVADALYPDCRTATVFTVGSSVGGLVTADATVCTGNNSGTLTLAGHTGSILRWESSIDNFVTTVTIANTTTTQNYLNLTQTTKYRAVVQNGTCTPANSSPATITVSNGTVAGSVTADATVCTGSNSGTLTLTGHTGSILRWESSIDNFVTIVTIANTTTTQNYLNLTQTTKYRAVVQNGTCTEANSSSATITVSNGTVAGSVTADATVCTGSNSGTLTLAGHTGSILRWESSIDNFVTIVTIANTTTTQNYLNLTQTTKYRAVVQNGTCTSANSSSATITILAPAAPVASGATMTLGDPAISLTATGCTGVGFVLKWYQTSDNVEITMPVAPPVTTQYYAKCEQTVGATVCLSAKSNDAILTVVIPNSGVVVYVNIANIAAPIQNGNSWVTAYGNLQTALSSAPANSEIWVAQGTYKPTNNSVKTISFNIPSGVMIYGGFVGTEISQNQRNFTTNQTILSGEIGSVANLQDNSYHVVFFNGASNTTRLDGFTIRDGNSNYTPPSSIIYPSSNVLPVSNNDGGGIALDNASSPTIANCKILNNKAIIGAGIFATNNSTPAVINCVIMGNESTFGGGVYHLSSNGDYKNVLIAGNKAIGGGMYNNISNPTLTNVTIAGNGGTNGGIFNSASNPVVKNSIVWGNIGPFNDTQSTVTYSIVEGGYTGIGNLNLNPQLISISPFGLSPNVSGDYQLTNTSPAIDAGNNGAITLTDKDLIGNLRRFNGGIVDMGAYEFQGSRIGGTVISIISGNWENGSTWMGGVSPLAGDNVIINNNHNVTILNLGTAKNVEIRTNAKIIHSTASSKLQTGL